MTTNEQIQNEHEIKCIKHIQKNISVENSYGLSADEY